MSKKAQHFQQYQSMHLTRRRLIEPVSMDELALFQDLELDGRAQFIRDEANRHGLKAGDPDAKPFEVEMAYVLREQGIRHARRVAHRQYLAAQDEGMVDESTLPEFKATPPPHWWN